MLKKTSRSMKRKVGYGETGCSRYMTKKKDARLDGLAQLRLGTIHTGLVCRRDASYVLVQICGIVCMLHRSNLLDAQDLPLNSSYVKVKVLERRLTAEGQTKIKLEEVSKIIRIEPTQSPTRDKAVIVGFIDLSI